MSFVHSWKPGKKPVILALHGTGGDENDLLPLAEAVSPGAAVLSPRGRVMEGRANRFFRRYGEGQFDQESMLTETEALASFIEESGRERGFSPSDLNALGFSNGANMAVSLMLRRPDMLSRAILFRAMVPFEPTSDIDLTGKKVFLANGTYDPIVPKENAERLDSMLRDLGAEVRHFWIATGHNLTSEDIQEARDWLAD